jgi:hypothetical protein
MSIIHRRLLPYPGEMHDFVSVFDIFFCVLRPTLPRHTQVDTFALDLSNSSRLWFVSNRLDLFITYTMDFTGAAGANFRVNM